MFSSIGRPVARAVAATGVVLWLCGAAQATTFTGEADFDTNYASSPGTNPIGDVTVTVGTGAQAGDLLFDVKLLNSYIFYATGASNGNTFVFDLDVAGASISNITSKNGTAAWSPVSSPSLGDGIGTNWDYGIACTTGSNCSSAATSEVTFVVSAASALSLSDVIEGADKHSVALWFAADVGQGSNTGLVGAQTLVTTQLSSTPLPGALALFGSVLFGGIGMSTWRKRRSNRGVVSLIA